MLPGQGIVYRDNDGVLFHGVGEQIPDIAAQDGHRVGNGRTRCIRFNAGGAGQAKYGHDNLLID